MTKTLLIRQITHKKKTREEAGSFSLKNFSMRKKITAKSLTKTATTRLLDGSYQLSKPHQEKKEEIKGYDNPFRNFEITLSIALVNLEVIL